MKKNKIIIAGILFVVFFLVGGMLFFSHYQKTQLLSSAISIKTVNQKLVATGVVKSENEATLTFPTGGKLVYLPFKNGDSVYAGQTIAQLDTYALQKQLEIALNAYRSARDTFDQTQQNAQTGVLQGQDRYTLEVANKGGFTTGDVENTIISDMVKRFVDQNQANLDNSVVSVELANYALQLATLTSPINGVLVREDVTNSGVFITPQTTFYIADPNQLVFRANIDETDIHFITVGASAQITLAGDSKKYSGNVEKILPQKVTLPNGENVYQVDIVSQELVGNAQLLQGGSVVIQNKFDHPVSLVPTWMVLGKNSIWVAENGQILFKKITIGETVGSMTEVVSGLTQSDKIIQNPQSLVSSKYIQL